MPQDYNFDTRIHDLQCTTQNLLDDLGAIENEISRQLAKFPEGRIYCQMRNGHTKFSENIRGTVHYLPISCRERIAELSQKKYLENLREEVGGSRVYLQKASDSLKNIHSLGSAYEKLNDGVKMWVTPWSLPEEEFEYRWSEEDFPTNRFKEEEKYYTTERGEQVRSKSELMDANIMHQLGLQYRYEQALFLGTRTVYPDFTILDPYTHKEVYFEHFGMMGQSDYAVSALKKMQDYENAGYQLGVDLLCYFESQDLPYSPNHVQQILERRFFKS